MSDVSASSGCERFFEETRDVSPANLLVKIECFSLFSKYGIDKYESRTFEAGGYKWKLIIYPDGENDYLSVYFSIVDAESLPEGWEVNAIFAFFVHNQLMDNYLCFRGTTRRFNSVIQKRGFSKLMSKKSLMDPSKGYVVDDGCVFGAEVFVIKSQRVNECLSLVKHTSVFKREWKISGFSKLGDVWNSEEFYVGNHKWKVELYPNGETSHEKGRYVSIHLVCVGSAEFGPHQKVKAAVLMFLKSELNATHHSYNLNHWFIANESWGFNEFISIDKMFTSGFLADDCCCVGVGN
ncbi:uncharacterized protein LOC131010417 [Salvia miltiorrhiza]|uniref:uncharacterized protein LOC131010417 n=1 Tax=Salvia miltiorrhiza TaxID=226208 RepID=UPI0025AC717A|nr:uncharacterized protein LOC131010417 [Salvia miltiorrhiza]